MRTRTLLATAAGLATVAATALPAAAIKYGEPDDGAHPYVGMMIAYVSADVDGDGAEELVAGGCCTGTQLDVDTFLTAGHCTYGAEAVAIWYDDDIDHLTGADFRLFDDAMVNADAYSLQAVSHPEYDDAAFYLHDAGIVDEVVLNDGVGFDQYGTLPELGYWDGQLATRKKDRDSTSRSATDSSGRCRPAASPSRRTTTTPARTRGCGSSCAPGGSAGTSADTHRTARGAPAVGRGPSS